YLLPLTEMLVQSGNEADAVFMKRYMKGQYEYFGIKSPMRREIMKSFLTAYGMPPPGRLQEITYDCWNLPQREYQYFIMEVLGKMAKKADKSRIGLYEFLIINKSWWDTVDYLAPHLIGTHFRLFPELIPETTGRWMNSGNLWLQRACLLFQLKYKGKTDPELLTGFIRQLKGSQEFFINKAIGWILREYSKTDPAWVKGYVEENHADLASLSKREALKWIERRVYFEKMD
ncbi:MAG: DNA alkylation repair protein, partial [Bacteroidales bacterium]